MDVTGQDIMGLNDTNAESDGKHLVEAGDKVCDNLVKGSVRFRAEMAISSNFVQQRLLCSLDVGQELLLELCDLGGVDLVQESPDTAVDDGHLLLDGHGHVLALLQQLGQSHTSVQQLLGGGVKIRSELGESCDLRSKKRVSIKVETLMS